MQTRVLEAVPAANSVLVGFSISQSSLDGSHRQQTVFQVMTDRDGRVSEIRGYPSRTEAVEHAGLTARPERMHVDAVVPMLNVSGLPDSFAWFEKLGWTRTWEW